jgi:hypothetical protein
MFEQDSNGEMTDRTSDADGTTDIRPVGVHESILFAAPIYEKKKTSRAVSYGMVLVTPERLIIIPFLSSHGHQGATNPEGDKPVTGTGDRCGPARNRDSSLPESFGSRVGDFLHRDAGEILNEENDARVLCFKEIREIIMSRVRTDSRSSRWLSILFALFPLEPAAARYRVDYQLIIVTPEHEYALVTPFSLNLKQILVDFLGNRVHEIIDDYAPLL